MTAWDAKPLTEDVKFDFLSGNEKIDVFYLEASLSLLENIPLLKNETHPLFTINAYHTGIAFQTSKYSFCFELVAQKGINAVFLPHFENGKLVWNNASQITYNDVDTKYWDHSTYICSINKKKFMELVSMILNDFIPNNTIYSFFRVSSSANLQDMFKPLLRSCICDDFCFYILDTLQNKLNASVSYLTLPKITLNSLIAKVPIVKLDENNPLDRQKIIQFYHNTLKCKLEEIYTDIMKTIIIDVEKLNRVNYHFFQQILYIIYRDLETIIYYTYDENNKPAYFQIQLTTPFLDITYVKDPIKNDFKPNSVFPQLQTTLTQNKKSNKNIIIYIIIGIILLLLVIIAIYFFQHKPNIPVVSSSQ